MPRRAGVPRLGASPEEQVMRRIRSNLGRGPSDAQGEPEATVGWTELAGLLTPGARP